MRWSIGFPAMPPVSLADSPSPPKATAPGQRRPLVVSGVSRLARQLGQLVDVGGDAPDVVDDGALFLSARQSLITLNA